MQSASRSCRANIGVTRTGHDWEDETMKAVFAGSFAMRLVEPVKKRLKHPCEIVTGDEAAILQQLSNAEVLVSMGFDDAMAAAAPRLRLLQVPGAGLDRIDLS